MKAVFADRDGVINAEVDNLHQINKLKLLPKVAEAIYLLNKFKIPIIIITNQPVVARGLLSEKEVEEIHEEIQKRLRSKKTAISSFYFCPHHPDANLKKYRMVCDCRKPNIGLFTKAAKDFKIDLSASYMIGDSFRDIDAGKKIGAVTIAVESGSSDFRKSVADYKVKNLYEAVQLILKKEKLI